MAYEKLHSLIERLNVNGVKSEFRAFPELKSGYYIINATCSSDDKNYIASLVIGMQQFFGNKLEVTSQQKLERTATSFFYSDKQFHTIILTKEMLIEICERFNISFDEVQKDCMSKINDNPRKEELNARQTL